MKKTGYTKVTAAALAAVFGLAGFAGVPANVKAEEVTQIKLATTPQYKPFVYQNDDGELVGYEVELARAVFDLLPQYELVYEYTDWQSVLTGLDSGMYQISAESIFYTEERAEKYYFSDPIFYDPIISIKANGDEKELTSLDALAGETITCQAGDIWGYRAEQYNETHQDNPIIIKYEDQDRTMMYSNIEEGNYYMLADLGYFLGVAAEAPFDLTYDLIDQETIDEYFGGATYTYFLFSRTDDSEQLVEDFNAALKEVMDNGTAKEISEKYFDGNDFTPAAYEAGEE